MDKHRIIPDSGDSSCIHNYTKPPWGSSTRGRDGELRRCPDCLKWWYLEPGMSFVWYRVRWYHFFERRQIEAFEARERKQMHTIIGSDKIVEDN